MECGVKISSQIIFNLLLQTMAAIAAGNQSLETTSKPCLKVRKSKTPRMQSFYMDDSGIRTMNRAMNLKQNKDLS